jgi:ribosome-associated heat shock protein Hsp15
MSNNQNIAKVRIDKWLWAVRIFKSRTQATDACAANKITINGANAKPSQNVQRGDLVAVKKAGFNLSYKVVDLLDKRVGAELAAPCYENLTPAAELNKFSDWYLLNSTGEHRDKGVGRPTKRDRREIGEFKDLD